MWQRSRFRMPLAAMLLVLGLFSQARAQVDPPAGNGARRERLERLRKEFLESFSQIQARVTKWDFDALGKRLEELTASVLSLGPNVRDISIKIDPRETDFAQDRAAVHGGLTLLRTRWSEMPSGVNFDLKAQAVTDSEHPHANVKGEVVIDTDVVPFLNRILEIALRRMERKADRKSTPLDQKIYDLLSSSKITSLDDAADILGHIAEMRLDYFNNAIEASRKTLQAASSDADRQKLAAGLADLRTQRDKLYQVRLKIDRDELGDAIAINVTADGVDLGQFGEIDRLDAVLTKNQVAATADWKYFRGMQAYAFLKPALLAGLERIQNGDELVHEFIGGTFGEGGLLDSYRKEIFGD